MMSSIRARVRNGRLIVDEPTSLPEGTQLDLVIEDAGDNLDDAERAALNTVISRAWASVQAGEGRAADDVLADLAGRDQLQIGSAPRRPRPSTITY